MTVIRQENSDNFIITKPNAIRISIQRFMIVDHMFLLTIFLINVGKRISVQRVLLVSVIVINYLIMCPIKPLVELRRLVISKFQPTTPLSLLNL